MASSSQTDVIVIGAGPVGLTLASELQRHGARVRLVEKKTGPNEHPNAAVVHSRTLEILSAMGAIDGFLEEGYPLPGMHFHFFGKRSVFVDLKGVDSPFSHPRCLGQQYTEKFLGEHFTRNGGVIERGIEAIEVGQDADGVRVKLKHLTENGREEIATARYVVGCEGSASLTRESAKIPFDGERYQGKEFLQIDANVRWTYPHGYGYAFRTEKQALLFFPYKKPGHYRIICAQDDSYPEKHEPPTLEEMQAHVRKIADPAAELFDPLWFNRFRSGHRIAARFREGRAFLAGDAGHVHVPIGGQGMNYGMHDAFNLAWKLAAVVKGEAKPELLDTYEAERHGVDEALIKFTDRAYHIMVQPNALAEFAVHHIAPNILGLEVLQDRVRNFMGEMNVAYPASTLTEDHGGSHGPKPGDRAPDAVIVRMPGRTTETMFDVLRTPKWTLLLFTGMAPSVGDVEALEKLAGSLAGKYGARMAAHLVLPGEPPVPVHANWAASVLMDRQLYAHEKYGATSGPCVYLIRPDWYVGFRSGIENRGKLAGYLERVFMA
jgi:2-polyprenyl-6-methoxyphenol hydroxylase-like FAD-dependent oxidoreductase